jgi:glyoxylase-like metal-dependent hydrolase (beta-lactamase superfamily II)/8-oxo-dGTP pyrophosphatase MutT (NUDIX family)
MARAHTASLLVMRTAPDDGARQIYWVQRRRDASFLPGFHAFPGGAVDPEDFEGEPTHDPAAVERACRRAAVRETLEEIGVEVPLAALNPAGRWTAPPYLGRGFETRYYVAEVAPDTAPAVGPAHQELLGGAWITPADALAAWARSEVLLAPPTLSQLRALAGRFAGESAPAPPRQATTGRSTPADDAAAIAAQPHADGAHATFSEIRPHIVLFPVRTPTLPPATHTNCYVVGERDLLVFDAASPWPEPRAALDAYLDARIAAGATVRALVVTHPHHDHFGGVGYLADRLGAPVWAHPGAADRLERAVDRPLGEGDTLVVDGRHRLRVLHTPGHQPHHLCFLDEGTGSLIAGDMVAGLGTILIDPDEGSMREYLEQLERLAALEPSCLLPSHGQVIGGAREKLSEYVAHRLMREGKVVDALRAGGGSLMELVPRAYDDVPEALWPLAARSMLAHLHKLSEESRAAVEGDRWRLTDRNGGDGSRA